MAHGLMGHHDIDQLTFVPIGSTADLQTLTEVSSADLEAKLQSLADVASLRKLLTTKFDSLVNESSGRQVFRVRPHL